MSFSDADAGGWDECLPSVAECVVPTEKGPATIPDHGDLWRVTWRVIEATADSATMRASCFSLPLELIRSVILRETATGWRIHLLYTLSNSGNFPVPWSWAAHPLFAAEHGDRILLPSEIHSVLVEGSAGGTLGTAGQTIPWPITERTSGLRSDLSQAQEPGSGIGDKVFAGPICAACDSGWAILERPRLGLRLTVRFDATLTPYLGLWLCYGGWPDGSGPKQVCVAPEPTTAPVDSLAKTGPWSRWLEPGATYSWPMELSIDSIDRLASTNASQNQNEDRA
jgi:galactose mutarotase-like enzyme